MITIVGNKCDLVEDEGYNVSSIENLLQDINGFYTVTSAKNGIGIDVNILSAHKNYWLETFWENRQATDGPGQADEH